MPSLWALGLAAQAQQRSMTWQSGRTCTTHSPSALAGHNAVRLLQCAEGRSCSIPLDPLVAFTCPCSAHTLHCRETARTCHTPQEPHTGQAVPPGHRRHGRGQHRQQTFTMAVSSHRATGLPQRALGSTSSRCLVAPCRVGRTLVARVVAAAPETQTPSTAGTDSPQGPKRKPKMPASLRSGTFEGRCVHRTAYDWVATKRRGWWRVERRGRPCRLADSQGTPQLRNLTQ